MGHLTLTTPEHAYLFGFLQADGHLSQGTRNRGKARIELHARDAAILTSFKALLPTPSSVTFRERDTNFKKGSQSAIWTLCDQDLRASLHALGLPYGKKSEKVEPPRPPFSEADYFRGFVDGDGSLGLTGAGFPFLSLATKSFALTQAFLGLVVRVTGKVKTSTPNTRDRMHNICVFKEDAQALARFLYYPGSLCLARKNRKAQQVLAWVRPATMAQVTWERRRWTSEEDQVVLGMSVLEAAKKLRRTEHSVRVRLSRLRCKE